MPTIDSLDIQIRSSAQKANREIGELVKNIGRLADSLKIDTSGLDKLSAINGQKLESVGKGLHSIVNAAKSVKNTKGSDFSKLADGLGKLASVDTAKLEGLSKINFGSLQSLGNGAKSLATGLRDLKEVKQSDFKKLSSGIEKLSSIEPGNMRAVAASITPLANGVRLLNEVNFDNKNLQNLINSLTRLSNANVGSLSGVDFSRLGESLRSFANAVSGSEKVPQSVIGITNAIAKLAQAGNNVATVTAVLPSLGNALKRCVNSISGADSVSDDVISFTQALGQLASAGKKAGETAASLDILGEKLKEFFHTMSDAPAVSESTIRMTQALAQLANAGGRAGSRMGVASASMSGSFSRIADAGRKSVDSVKKMFGGLMQATKNVGGVVVKISKSIAFSFTRIGSSSRGIDTANQSLKNLVKTVIGFKGLSGLMQFGKNAIGLGSDITEVENVVDVAFGSMANKAYEFASTATEQFGLSELAAKQYSGTMMAMLKSSGVAQGAAADMSTTLAGLAGDIASFYNLDTDLAFYKIRAGISGEIEPLKQLGINMSVANMEAYALANGISKTYNEMSQAEKTTLRYNYLLSVTGDQQGDFARTAGTYANQWRLLKLNIQSVSAVLGQGLIAAILPAVQALNKLMSVLMKAAQAFKTFMYTLTGKKLEGSMGGVVNEFSGFQDGIDGMEGIADAEDDAASSAKKLEKALSVLSFDELNQLAGNLGSKEEGDKDKGDAVPGISNPGIGDFGSALDELGKMDVEGPIDEWARRIRRAFLKHDWEKLGEEIAWGLNKGLQAIYDAIKWENVGPKITAFIDAFTRTFNSLADHLDWDLLGRTIGAGINTLVNSFNLLAEGIDFENLGRKLSVGLRGMISEIEWENLGNALGNYFMVAWRILEGFVDDMWRTSDLTGLTGWQELGKTLAEGVKGIFDKVDFGQIGETLSSGINGAFQTLQQFTRQMEADGTWGSIAENITTGLNNMIHGIKWAENGQILSDFVVDLLGTIQEVAAETDWYALGKGIGDFLSAVDWGTIFGQVFSIITDVLGGLISGLASTTAGKLGIALVAAIGGIKLAGAALPLASAISLELAGEGFSGKIASGMSGAFEKTIGLFKSGGAVYEALGVGATNLSIAFEGLTGVAVPVGASMAAIVAAVVAIGVALVDLWKTSDTFRSSVKNAFENVKESVVGAFEKIKEAITPLWESIKELGNTLYDFYEGSGLKSIVALIASLAATLIGQGLSTLIDTLGTAFAGLAEVLTGAIEIVSGIFDVLTGIFTLDFDRAVEGFEKIGRGILDAFGGIKDRFLGVGSDIINGLFEGIEKVIETVGDWLKEHVVDPIVNNVKEFFGIHSPSTVFAEIGGFLMEGLKNGLTNTVGNVLKWFGELPGMIKNKLGNAKDWLVEKGKNALEGLRSGWDAVKESSIGQAAQSMAGYVKSKAGDAKNWLSEKGKNAIEGLRNGWEAVRESAFLSKVSNIGSEVIGKIGNIKAKTNAKGQDVITGILAGYNAKVGELTAKIGELPNIIYKILGAISSNVKSRGSEIVIGIRTGFENEWGRDTSWLSGIPQKISSAIGSLYSTGQSIMNSLADGMRSVHIPVPQIYMSGSEWQDFGGGAGVSIPRFGINWYAKGGLFSNPSVIGVGEAGREAVLPLENQRTMGMISSAILDGMNLNLQSRESPFMENVALYTQKIESWCANFDKRLSLQEQYSDRSIDILSGISGKLDAILGVAKSFGMQSVQDIVGNIAGSLDSGILYVGDAIVSSAEHIIGNISAMLNSGISYLGGSLSSLATSIAESVSAGVNVLSTNFSESISSLMGTAPDDQNPSGSKKTKPIKRLNISPNPNKPFQLATGGLVEAPIWAHIGERNRREAVLPLEDPRAMSAIAESIYANSQTGGIGLTKEEIREAVVEGVVTAMMNNSANQSQVNVNCYATLRTENDEVLARAVARGQNSLDYRMNPA